MKPLSNTQATGRKAPAPRGTRGDSSFPRCQTGSRWLLTVLFLFILALLPGCGGPPAIPGGTRGRVHMDGTPLSDVHVTVHRVDEGTAEPLAFAISDAEGTIELRMPGSLEGVWLEPGEYTFTIESTGEVRMVWPGPYGDPHRTPLRKHWHPEDDWLELSVPEPRVMH